MEVIFLEDTFVVDDAFEDSEAYQLYKSDKYRDFISWETEKYEILA